MVYVRVLCSLFILILTFLSYAAYQTYVVTGEVDSVYQKSVYNDGFDKVCKSTVVLVNDAPSGRSGKRRLWLKNSKKIIEKWEPFTEKCDSLVFLKNIKEQARRRSELNYWMGDNQYCLEGVLDEKKCISKESQLFSIALWRAGGDFIGKVNDKPIYIYYINYG